MFGQEAFFIEKESKGEDVIMGKFLEEPTAASGVIVTANCSPEPQWECSFIFGRDKLPCRNFIPTLPFSYSRKKHSLKFHIDLEFSKTFGIFTTNLENVFNEERESHQNGKSLTPNAFPSVDKFLNSAKVSL